MDKQVQECWTALEERVQGYIAAADRERLHEALLFAEEAHRGQKRRDGSPFVTHPIAVAEILAEMCMDAETLIAALLHDCIEDTGVTHEEIVKRFGITVAELVEGVTKLTRVQYTSKEEEQMENLRKMFLAMAKDIRVIIIKIADRLHNMRTMNYQREEKQRMKSLETMEIYAPIAHRLGMQKIKWELEDRSLEYLDPYGYKELSDSLERNKAVHGEILDRVRTALENGMREAGIHGEVFSRLKHIYSIYRKVFEQHKTFGEVYDIYAFRVIVDSVQDCYNALGVIHDLYKPVLGRLKDYIAVPKPNGYQSLHTTVVGREGIPFEVQIRTQEMHQMAEYGVAAHWKYKQGMADVKLGTEKNFEWVRRLLENQQDTDPEEFVRTLKVDMFADEVFVFTPKGDVINLPAHSTPIDFAYSIHSEVGNTMTAARVNGHIVPFSSELKNGDVVEVLSSKAAHGPSRDWMKIARSNEARTKIRQWFKRERREENIIHGRASFEAELRRNGISLSEITAEDVLPAILKKVSFNTLDDMYAAIGYGGLTSQKAVNRIKDELMRINKLRPQTGKKKPAEPPKAAGGSTTGIVVEGLDNCLVKFARCCTPVPGDAIIGFITKGYGVSVHRTDCPNATAAWKKDHDKGRWVGVSWRMDAPMTLSTGLELYVSDRDSLVMDITTVLSTLKTRLTALATHKLPEGRYSITLSVEVDSLQKLNQVLARLQQVPGVLRVNRVGARTA